VLRDAGSIAPAAPPPSTPQDQIFEEFGNYLRTVIRRFLHEMCPAGAGDLGRVRQEDVMPYHWLAS
jgi:hypothetical protein